MKKKIIFLVSVSTISFWANAQNANLLEKIRAANQNKEVSYDYKIVLRNMKKAKNVDSTSGKLYTLASQYVDSNTYQYIARVGNYFCRFDHQEMTATICDINLLSRKNNIKFNEKEQKVIFNISDSLLAILGTNYVIDSTSKHFYRLKVRLKNYSINYLQFDFSKASYRLIAAYYEMEDHSDDEFYLTQIMIRNVNHSANQKVFDLSRLFTIIGSKPILKGKYNNYKLTPIE